MSKGRKPRHAPRIVALGMQGLTAQAVAQRIGCGEEYAARVLRQWRAEGGDLIARDHQAQGGAS